MGRSRPHSHYAIFSLIAFFSTPLVSAQAATAVAAQYTLTATTTLPFPTATQNNANTQSYLVQQWSLSRGRIESGPNDLAFVSDPFPNSPAPGGSGSTTGPVLEVTYPAGSFSGNTGGAQLYSLWNTSAPLQSMLLSYEVAFDAGFDWVMGGKLPGLRGGPDPLGCSGGNKPNGANCFSTRMMWRTNGAGETYAYIPTPNGLCNETDIICNSDFGTSLGRGSFSFVSGQWNRVTILVQMNNPPNIANGNLHVYYNDVQAITQQDLQYRSSTGVSPKGLYLSTFFGGHNSSWSTPMTTHTYFRNFQLWGGHAPSNLTGARVRGGASRPGADIAMGTFVGLIMNLLVLLI